MSGPPRTATVIAFRTLRLLFAAFGAAAVAQAAADSTGSLVNVFSYFTIESNLLAIVALAVGGAMAPRGPGWVWFRGAATFYMLVTGIVYAALLANAEVGLVSPWVDPALHQVMPAVMVVDWICFSPWPARAVRPALAWLAFPLVYLAYSLSRGAAVDWYPYPFLDPRHPGGYGRVAVYCVVLALVMAALALAVAARGRLRSAAARGRPQESPVRPG